MANCLKVFTSITVRKSSCPNIKDTNGQTPYSISMKTRLLAVILLVFSAIHAQAQKYVGGDISLLTQYETHGARYYDTDKSTPITDLLDYFKTKGMNAMRVRLFVNPDNATAAERGQGVCQNLEYVKALGRRIKAAGFKLLLDFHYSDTWADPQKQWTPKDWLALNDEQLQNEIYTYTKNCLHEMKEAGAEPDFIQTGNEISYGMLWGGAVIDTQNSTAEDTKYIINSTHKTVYSLTGDNFNRFIALLKKAGNACREECPDAKIIIHTERVAKYDYLSQYYQALETSGVDFDIMGLSFYPYYHGNLDTLDTALNTLESAIPDKDIMIVEMAYHHKWQGAIAPDGADLSATYPITDEGQQQYTEALINILNLHNQVIGLFWWWMEANECGLDWSTQRVTDGWNNSSLFDNEQGYAMPTINSMKKFLEETSHTGINTISHQPLTNNHLYDLQGRKLVISKLSNGQLSKGIYIYQGKKTIL